MAQIQVPIADPKTQDVVCWMKIEPHWEDKLDYQGSVFHFCSSHCLDEFQKSPRKYLDQNAALEASKAPAPKALAYFCPMCPEVHSTEPGTCPKCGMALAPVAPTREQGPDPELVDMQARLWRAIAFGVPLFLLAMGEMLSHELGVHLPGAMRENLKYVQLLLCIPVVFWAGFPILRRAVQSITTRSLNMFTLIGFGTVSAFCFSVVAALSTTTRTAPLYFETSAVLVIFVLLGQVLELRARARTQEALRGLLDLTPPRAWLVGSDAKGRTETREVPLSEVKQGAVLRVRSGEKIPVDGEVTEGQGLVDSSMMTGESMPVEVASGSKVFGGTINLNGSFLMRALAIGEATMLARMIEIVAGAQRTRAPIQRLADRVSSWFVPTVLGIAAVTAMIWWRVGPEPHWVSAALYAVSVLMVACPCALGLATPMAVTVASGAAARRGILVRDAAALERLASVDTFVFDKTGTLTEGRPKLETLIVLSPWDRAEILALVAALEQGSPHPMSRAITQAAMQEDLALAPVTKLETLPGKGIRGVVAAREVAVGARDLFEAKAGEEHALIARAEDLRRAGQTVAYIVVDGAAVGLIGVIDPLKKDAELAVRSLQKLVIELVLASGDNYTTAHAIATQLGISTIHSQQSPQDKALLISEFQKKGRIVAMLGDGVNDAPALAAASVGIAMATGTEIAMDAAGITLLRGDLLAALRAHALSKKTLRNIKQNLAFALGYNVLAIPLAAGLFLPLLGAGFPAEAGPMLAAVAMSFSSVSVIANSLRLRKTP